MLTDIQLKLHNNHITGSKVASILRLNPYESKYECFARMKDLLPPKEQTDIMKAGLYAEEAIEKWCINEWGWKVVKLPETLAWREHNKYKMLGGFIDRLLNIHGNRSKFTHVGEFKNISYRNKDSFENGIPEYYQCQLHFYNMLWELDGILVACIGGNDYKYFHLDRNKEIEEFITEECVKFWEDLQNERWPDPDETDSTSSAIKQLFPRANDNLQPGTPEILESAIQYNHWREKEAEAKKEKQKFANIITNAIGDNLGFSFNDNKSRITWKQSKDSEKFNLDKFKKDHPDIYKEYLINISGARRLHIKI
ncbi:MAG: YqaJ viral recombinase family protein [Candidatus Thorarchaeota archaeon]